MDKQKSINALQFFVTNLSNQAFGHKLQGKVFADQGFEKGLMKEMNVYETATICQKAGLKVMRKLAGGLPCQSSG